MVILFEITAAGRPGARPFFCAFSFAVSGSLARVAEQTGIELAFPPAPDDLVDLDEAPATNLKNPAKAKKVDVSDLVVCILDRPRGT